MATPYSESFGETTPFSDTTTQLALAASTVLTYTVPGTNINKYKVDFSFPVGSNVWVGYNVTAVTPAAGTILSNANIERNPTQRLVKGGDVLSFKSNAIVTDAGFRLFSLPG